MSTDNPITLPRRAVLAAGPSLVVDRCRQWLATDAEAATLEARLEELRGEQARRLRDIADAEVQDLRDVVGKLAVVAAAIRDDGGPIHDIVIEALATIAKPGIRKYSPNIFVVYSANRRHNSLSCDCICLGFQVLLLS